jgi:glycosyltransferase involved in cell wall biosynthesis
MRICAFSRVMGAHRPYYPSLIALLTPMLTELGHEVTVLTTAMPDGTTGRRTEGIADVHYLAGTQADVTDQAFWTISARTFDQLHAERPFDLAFGRGRSVWGFVSQSAHSGEVPLVMHEGSYPRWLHQVETRTGRLAPLLAYPLAPLFALRNRETLASFQAAARVVCLTPALATAIQRASWWRKPRAVPLIYGFDPTSYHPAPPPPGLPPRLVSIGRITWDKGILPMIDVLARLKNRSAVLEAIGPAKPKVLKAVLDYARRRGVADRYSAPGPVVNDDVPRRLAGAAAFLFPSTHAEGLGKVVLEAMAAGVPVVAYRLPVLEGLIDDGVTGFLVPMRSIDAMTERVDRLLADPALAARMGAAARQKLEDEFRPKVINAKWKVLLSEVMAEAQQRRVG